MSNLNNDLIALKLAGLEVCRIENEKYKSFEFADITIPDDVDRRITKLIDAYEAKKEIKATIIRVACIVIAVLVVGGAILTVNVEAREKLLKFLRKDYGSTIEYTPNNNEVNSIGNEAVENKTYTFDVGWIPEGYELIREVEHHNGKRSIFKSECGQVAIGVFPIGSMDVIGYVSNDGQDIQAERGDYNGLFYEFVLTNDQSKNSNLLVVNELEKYYVQIDAPLERDVIFKIYQNIFVK